MALGFALGRMLRREAHVLLGVVVALIRRVAALGDVLVGLAVELGALVGVGRGLRVRGERGGGVRAWGG